MLSKLSTATGKMLWLPAVASLPRKPSVEPVPVNWMVRAEP